MRNVNKRKRRAINQTQLKRDMRQIHSMDRKKMKNIKEKLRNLELQE